MANPEEQIVRAVEAIRDAVKSDLALSGAGVAEIERQVSVIVSLTKRKEVEREGAYLNSRVKTCHLDRDTKSTIVLDARLQGAVARFEFCLRQLGFVHAEPAPARQTPSPPKGAT